MRDSPLLIIDGPSAALDTESETWIRENLLQSDRTVIIGFLPARVVVAPGLMVIVELGRSVRGLSQFSFE